MSAISSISGEIALIWISHVLIDDKSSLVRVMAWCRQAASHNLNQYWWISWSPYTLLGANGLIYGRVASGLLTLLEHTIRRRTAKWMNNHDDVIKWKHFPRNWPFVRGIHRSPVNSPHKGQWRGALIFSLICVWINDWVNNREAGDLRRYRAHYDVVIMLTFSLFAICLLCYIHCWQNQ